MNTCPACGAQYPKTVLLCARDGTVLESSTGAEDPQLGKVLDGKYRLDAFVSQGGMGSVYRATHVMLDKVVAVKLIKPELVPSPDIVRRFQREARAASNLNHPNIVAVYDLGQTPDGTLYIAMEFIDGPSLSELIRKGGPVSTSRTLDILRQIASALSLAHKHNIIHRDLKSQNLMLATDPDGHEIAKLLDFGIAKTFEEGMTQLTRTGLLVGTPQYMAPEQAAGQPVDARTDLYSLGVIVYEMLTCEVPFNAESALAVIFKHMTEPPPVPSVRFPNLTISPALEAISLRCLEKEPDKRFQTADEFAAALNAVPIPSASPPPGTADLSTHVIVPIAHPGTPAPAMATPKPSSASQLAPTLPIRPMAASPVPLRPTVAAAPASQPPPSPAGGTRPTVPAAEIDHVAPSAPSAANAAVPDASPAPRSSAPVFVYAAAAVLLLLALGVVALQRGYVSWPAALGGPSDPGQIGQLGQVGQLGQRGQVGQPNQVTAPVSAADVPVATPASAASSGGTQPPPVAVSSGGTPQPPVSTSSGGTPQPPPVATPASAASSGGTPVASPAKSAAASTASSGASAALQTSGAASSPAAPRAAPREASTRSAEPPPLGTPVQQSNVRTSRGGGDSVTAPAKKLSGVVKSLPEPLLQGRPTPAASTPAAAASAGPPVQPPATPALSENPPVFFQCTGERDICAALRAAVDQALEKGGLPSVRIPVRAEVVMTMTVTALDERIDRQFGTTFAVRTYSVDTSAETTRSSQAVPMPAARTFSFDPRFGRERVEENARVLSDAAVDKVRAFWKRLRTP